ncbi:MAG: DUF5668 domain-containing protein [Candidatus Promineifilaceae bacterium]
MGDSVGFKGSRHGRKHGRSLFGPIMLIAVGVYFLLVNLGMVDQLYWDVALRFWPLILIFSGVNVIVRQFSQPVGTFLSALVALTAVSVFGYLLIVGENSPIVQRFGAQNANVAYKSETISFTPEEVVETAVVRLDFGAEGANLFALEDSSALIQGEVTYLGELRFDTEVDNGEADIYLDAQNGSAFWFNPANWAATGNGRAWEIGLNPRIPLDLRLDLSSGAAYLDLAKLTLNNLTIDASSGRSTLILPPGRYDVNLDASSGTMDVTLPDQGDIYWQIDASSGSIHVHLPQDMAARVDIALSGSGAVRLDRARFSLVQGSEEDEEVWETADYGRAINRIEIIIDMSSGSFTIE